MENIGQDEKDLVRMATKLFYACDPIVDSKMGLLYLPISEVTRLRRTKIDVLTNLNVEELTTTFRLLDTNGDGKLTLAEFVDGFTRFLANNTDIKSKTEDDQLEASASMSQPIEITDETQDAEYKTEGVSAEQLKKVLNTPFYETVKSTIPKAKIELDSLINQASKEVEEMQKSMQQLEEKLKHNTEQYQRSLEQAYTESDMKLKQKEEDFKIQQYSNQLHTESDEKIREKAEQIEELRQRMKQVEKEAEEVRHWHEENEKQIQKLQVINDELLESVSEAELSMEESKEQIEELQSAAKMDQVKRGQTDASTCSQVQVECEELVQKLDSLRDLNRHLRDERDEALHEHRLRNLISHGSLQDEFNEASASDQFDANDSHQEEYPSPQIEVEPLDLKKHAIIDQFDLSSDDDGVEFEYPMPDLIRCLQSKSMARGIELCKADAGGVVTQAVKGSGDTTWHSTSKHAVWNTFNVLIIGRSGVGKTTMMERLSGVSKTMETPEGLKISMHLKQFDLEDQQILLKLFDIPITEKNILVNQHLCRRIDGVIFIYDITSMTDFNRLSDLVRSFIDQWKNTRKTWDDSVNMLLGNKCDIVPGTMIEEGGIISHVPRGSAEWLAEQVKATRFETSGTTGLNIDAAMEDYVRRLCAAQAAKMEMTPEELDQSITGTQPCCAVCCSLM